MKKVRIFGWVVPIVMVKDLAVKEDAAGQWCPLSKTISIDKDLDPDERMGTLLHEMMHATFNRAGISQTGITSQLEEIICEQVAAVIMDNFKLTLKK